MFLLGGSSDLEWGKGFFYCLDTCLFLIADSPGAFGIVVSFDAALQRLGIIVAPCLFWAFLGGGVLYVRSSWFYRFRLVSSCSPQNALATALHPHPHAPAILVPLESRVF